MILTVDRINDRAGGGDAGRAVKHVRRPVEIGPFGLLASCKPHPR